MSDRKRAVIYCRVSTEKQEIDGESLEYQEEKCRQYANLNDVEVIAVLSEAKSGYIHYTLRDARQFIRDGMADMIIVWDLRRFSRNFVHSAMIFEEIESHHGEVVSVSEKIDNSLTSKLIRSILAWSAESEREKIVEYANRHWQARLEHNLPMGTGRAPYGWEWKDETKTGYKINPEELAVRISIFEMFVKLDMSIRAIAHKLTENGILPPAKSRGVNVEGTAWHPSTVHKILTDPENIGIITISRTRAAVSETGQSIRKPSEFTKVIPGGIPAVITIEKYERAQAKLKNNKADKSHVHKNAEDFLLKGHVTCKTCGYRMHGRNRGDEDKLYTYYECTNRNNKYSACPDQPNVRADWLNEIVWQDCCRVFERLELIRDVIEQNIEQSVRIFWIMRRKDK